MINKISTRIGRKINNVSIQVPLINGLGFANVYISELWMCSLLKKIIAVKNGSFIDVGVNVGQTLIKLRTVDSDIDYVGFEPNPKCVYYTDILIKTNKFKNCRIIPVGIYNRDTVLLLDLYSDGDTDSAASVIENFRPNEKVYNKIFVPVSQFENINELLDLKEIAIIKIDVEGAELEVLQSMQNTIRIHRPIIIIEILPCYTNENINRITRQEKIELILKELNYRFIRIIKNETNTIEKLEQIETIGIHGNIAWSDYILVPNELIDQIL